CRHYNIAGIETLGDDDRPRVVTQQFDISERNGETFWVDDPDGRLSIELGQGGGRNGNDRFGFQLDAAGDGSTEPHSFWRVAQPGLDLECSGHRVSLRRDLSHPPGRHHTGIVTSLHCNLPL